MKKKLFLFLMFVFFTHIAYTQINTVTKDIINSTKCNNGTLSGLWKMNAISDTVTYYDTQYDKPGEPVPMQLGTFPSQPSLNIKSGVGRGYGEFDLISKIPKDVTIDSAQLFGKLYMQNPSGVEIIVRRHDADPFSCSNINQTGWNFLTGGTLIAGWGGMSDGQTVPIDILNDVINKRNGKLILSFILANESTKRANFSVERLKITYTKPPAPSIAPFLSYYKSNITSTSCTLTWSATPGPLLGYEVYMGGNPNPIKTVGTQTTSVNITGLQRGTTYIFYVRAHNSAGHINSDTLCVTTPSISGTDDVCYEGNKFSLNNPPTASITWTVTGPFSFSSTSLTDTSAAVSPTVYRKIGVGGYGTLSARYGSATGQVVDSKTITPCPLPSIDGPETVCYDGGSFSLVSTPSGPITWTVTGPFTFSTYSYMNSITVTQPIVYISGNGLPGSPGSPTYGTLSAYVGGSMVAGMYISPCKPTISGPTLVCSSTASFTVADVPSAYIWDSSPNIYLIPSGTTALAYFSPNYGPGWVSIKFSGEELARHDVWFGPPMIESISGATSVQIGSYFYSANVQSNLSEAINYQWSVEPTTHAYVSNYWDDAYVTYHWQNYNGYKVISKASNRCGTGPPFVLNVSWGRGGQFAFSVYPNPVSDILFVEIDAGSTDEERTNTKVVYEIHLYDGQANLLRHATTSGGTVQFDVSKLSNGFYYLHVYDGVNSNPEIQQIIVEH